MELATRGPQAQRCSGSPTQVRATRRRRPASRRTSTKCSTLEMPSACPTTSRRRLLALSRSSAGPTNAGRQAPLRHPDLIVGSPGMGGTESALTPLEHDVIATLIEASHPVMDALREQLAVCRAGAREVTTAGSYTGLVVPPEIRRAPVDRLMLVDIHADVAGLQHGAGFILWVECGVVTRLGTFTYGDPWPGPEHVRSYTLAAMHPQGNTPTDMEQAEIALTRAKETL